MDNPQLFTSALGVCVTMYTQRTKLIGLELLSTNFNYAVSEALNTMNKKPILMECRKSHSAINSSAEWRVDGGMNNFCTQHSFALFVFIRFVLFRTRTHIRSTLLPNNRNRGHQQKSQFSINRNRIVIVTRANYFY